MLLKVTDISKSYGGVSACDGVNVSLNEGELRAIIGPNGAGKSTLFSLIAGRIQPSRGSVAFKGQQIDQLALFQRARLGISIMYQNPASFPGLTVLESVMLGAHRLGHTGFIRGLIHDPALRREERMLHERAVTALDRLGLMPLAERQTTELSFGQLRRIQLARSLASEPKLLLLDEPASGLHHGERLDFAAMLRRLHEEGLSMMMIEHDMELVMNIAETVTVMNLGTVLAEGTPAEVQQNHEVISAYLGGPAA